MSEAVATSQQGLVEKYQPYPEYDDSGIEWLGRIPVHWKLATLKHECVFSGGGTPTKDNLAYWGGNIPWISPKDMKSQVVTDSIDKITAVAVAESSTKLVPEGALLMVVRSGILQRTIPVAINTVPVTLNQDMKALRFKSKDKACFFLYYTQGLESQLLLEWCKQGATVESIEHELLANARYPLPPNDELKAINQFLDYETARIDRLIAQQLRLIELLKEKRQAVISHAVTKGLNPNAPMKYSGVEWLGQVPEHWIVRRLKHHIISMDQGWSPQCEARLAEEDEFGVMKVGCVNGGVFRFSEHKALPAELEPKTEYRLKKGQLLVSRANTRELVGSAAVVDADYDQLLLCDKLYRIKLSSDASPEFVALLLGTSAYRGQIELSASGASDSMQNIGQSTIKELPIAVPPMDEANDILKYVAARLCTFDCLNNQLQQQNLLLQERRTALISAAVTGKIDLRGWTPPAEEAAA
ncbi:TPA: restriction endonuclease subunit S [Aeromonas hydrophila]|nr:restriction endonuclease subunit S [Aeromonas hydrophila]